MSCRLSGYKRAISSHTVRDTIGAGTDDMEEVHESTVPEEPVLIRASLWNGQHKNHQQAHCKFAQPFKLRANAHGEDFQVSVGPWCVRRCAPCDCCAHGDTRTFARCIGRWRT